MEYPVYSIENDILRVTVSAFGAQVVSAVRKSDGTEHIWQGDPAVWSQHAPILFPHTGKVAEDTITVDGVNYPSQQHGFAMRKIHGLVLQEVDRLILALESTPETLAVFPFAFRLLSEFRLEGDSLYHALTVINPGDRDLSFGIGFHPGFAIPFDDAHTYADYEFRFSQKESPLCVSNRPRGLLNGSWYYLGQNIDAIPITDSLFSDGCHAMVNLQSRTLGVYEKGSGRGVVCDIAPFPYTLIWSKPGMPRFVCIEPWHSLASREDSSTDWLQKPAAAVLQPGQRWHTCLRTRFVRE